MEDVTSALLEQIREAANQELPVYTPAQWLEALQQLVAARAGANAALLPKFLPELAQLAESVRFELGDEGLVVVSDHDSTTLIKLRRGTLWFKGGDVEAELLVLLGEPRT